MLTAQELKERMTTDDVEKILHILNAKVHENKTDVIITDTICHHGIKPKLYLFKDSNQFHCFTNCGSFDVIELVCKVKEFSFIEAINWICIQLGYSTFTYGFGEQIEKINDWEFINPIRNRKNKKPKDKTYDFYDRTILNIFQKMYLKEWIDEGITIESLLKYEIAYSTLQQKVIIPHFNINYQLMGVRVRSTIDEEVDVYGKYSPFQINNMIYSHPISQNLFGIHVNKETIKKKKKIMLVEGEKGVLQCDSMFGDENFTVALCGSNLSDYQRDLIVSLGVNEVIIALDKQYHDHMSEEADKWAKHIRDKLINKLAPYCVTTILWDNCDLLPYKGSPTDVDKTTLLKLMDNKIYTGCMV